MDKSVELVLACRYLYYCKNISYLSDSEYDSMERYAKTKEGGWVLHAVSSDLEQNYSNEIKQFAQTLLDGKNIQSN